MPPERSDAEERIGPYRILRRLGAGGMGEVLLARDDRLDRCVAVKRIRPGTSNRPEQRERFRREARMAARLSHPAIVHVYDILAEDGTDFIVMEYVEGESLNARLAGGPLPVREVLDLARELADGLEAAHRQGIVHRDLKSENVLVTPAGRPKIADFGVAKRLIQEPAEGEEKSLTADHLVVGTYRSMSPEQARGEPVDHRTDLFSLGVMLYEALAGESPFTADNGLATLNRVIHHRQRPLSEMRPEVPQPLSNLVDHLLEKDPRLRPRSAGEVRRELDRLALATGEAGTLGGETIVELPPGSLPGGRDWPRSSSGAELPEVLAASGARPWRRRLAAAGLFLVLAGLAAWAGYSLLRRPGPPLYVAVLAPKLGARGGAEAELLAAGVRIAVLQELTALQGISPQAFEEVDAVAGTPRQVARAVAADEILGTRLDCRPEVCQVAITRRRGADGSVLWAESFDAPTDDSAVLASAVRAQVKRAYSDRAVRAGVLDAAASPRDFDELLRLRRRFEAGREPAPGPLLAALAALRRRSPRFVEAYLLEAQVLRGHYWASHDSADLERALALVRQVRELAPGDPRPLLEQADLAFEAGKPDLAGRAVGELAALIPGDARLLERQARLAEARGQKAEALGRMRSAARLQPSARRLHNLAQMELRRGEVAAARRSLELLLARSPHNYDGLSLLAQIEMAGGDLGRAVALYSELVRTSPGLAELSNLGLAYFLEGRYDRAAEAFHQAWQLQPKHPVLNLNLADAYLLLGRTAEARELYAQVVALVEADPSATAPQYLTVKAQALAHLKRGPQAAAAAQEALRLAPGEGNVALEAALVYALLGEQDSALASAANARRLGVEPRWLSLPWFGPLRQRAEFQALLQTSPPR